MSGGIQARTAQDARWFNPDRDIIWAFPKLISASLRANLDAPPEEMEKIGLVAKEVASIINSLRTAKLTSEEAVVRLKALDQRALSYISHAFFYGFFAHLYNWCGEIAPIPGDRFKPLEFTEFEKLVEHFARASRPETGGGNAPTA